MSASHDEENKIQKFNGRLNDDYNLWRIRAEAALKGKGYWKALHDEKCTVEVKQKSSAMIIHALGDAALRVCMSDVDEPLEMLASLDSRYASNRATTRIALLTSLYAKRYRNHENMAKYIDEFESLFAQIEKMGKEAAVPETHKAPILLASMGTSSQMESIVAVMRMRDTVDLKWETVTADLIEEWRRHSSKNEHQKGGSKFHREKGSDHGSRFFKGRSIKTKNDAVPKTCDFCGKKGHTSENCFINPASPKCKLSNQAKISLLDINHRTSSTTEIKDKPTHFGGLIRHIKKAQNIADSENMAVLDSGATVSMFAKPCDVVAGSYETGSNDYVELAAGSATNSYLMICLHYSHM